MICDGVNVTLSCPSLLKPLQSDLVLFTPVAAILVDPMAALWGDLVFSLGTILAVLI